MSDFEWWFLLVYTTYAAISILALMWVGRERTELTQKRLQLQDLGAKR